MSEPLLRIRNHHTAASGDPPIVPVMTRRCISATSKTRLESSGYLLLTVQRAKQSSEVRKKNLQVTVVDTVHEWANTDTGHAYSDLRITQNQANGPPSLNWMSFKSGRVSNRACWIDSTSQPSVNASWVSSCVTRRGASSGGFRSLKQSKNSLPSGLTTLASPST